MVKIDWMYVDKWSKKIRAINYLGGSCKNCGDNNIFHLCFHHVTDNKEFNINNIKTNRWSDIFNEIRKCDILCNNCHQEIHYVEDSVGIKWRNNKKLFLDYKSSECEICGYNKNQGSLVFHHINPEEKLFSISRNKIRYINELNDYIIIELDKCKVLCHNCHSEEHINISKFNRLKEEIYKKVNNYKEIQSKLDRDVVYDMYDSGIKQIEIAKYFNASKGTISGIIKNRKK